MKKGYVLFVLVGVAIGWWILKVNDSKNNKIVLLSGQKTNETEIKTTNNLAGESIETVESVGIVESRSRKVSRPARVLTESLRLSWSKRIDWYNTIFTVNPVPCG